MRISRMKCFVILSLLFIYINRGVFVAMPEMQTSDNITENTGEINSVLEFMISLFGVTNQTDEDGNNSESHSPVKFAQQFFFQEFFRTSELYKRYAVSVKKLAIPLSESIPALSVYKQIDRPPQS